jgi:hypothetical protein
MRNYKTIYRVLTGIFSVVLLFSAYYTGTQVEGFKRLGFPDYFRIELVTGKIIGAILLLIRQTPQRIREWIYAVWGINLISAFIAKLNSGFSILEVLLDPGIVFIVTVILIRYLDKFGKVTTE